MLKRVLAEADIVSVDNLTRLHRAYDVMHQVKDVFGEEQFGRFEQSVETMPVFELQLCVNGVATTLHSLNRRADGVVIGYLTNGQDFIVEDRQILDNNGAALEAGVGDVRKLEIRYGRADDTDSGKWIEDFDSYLGGVEQ